MKFNIKIKVIYFVVGHTKFKLSIPQQKKRQNDDYCLIVHNQTNCNIHHQSSQDQCHLFYFLITMASSTLHSSNSLILLSPISLRDL